MNKHHELVSHKHTCKLPKSCISEDNPYQWWPIKGSGRQWKASFCKFKDSAYQYWAVEDSGKIVYYKLEINLVFDK